jgi:hypothetical protein
MRINKELKHIMFKIIKAIAKKNDDAMKFMNEPLIWKFNNFLPSGFKLKRGDVALFLSVYYLTSLSACSQDEAKAPAPTQVEQPQNQNSEVPAIKIIDNKLFVDGNEMLAKDFVQKFCFAKRDNQTCVEAIVLNRIQDRHTGGAKPNSREW